MAGGIKLPAHGMVTLQPGGLHVMLMGLSQDLKEGNVIMLTLHFDDGFKLTSMPFMFPLSV